MAEEWVKLHTSVLGDPKLMRAARKGAKGLEMVPWLFAFAKAEGRDGALTVSGEPAEPEDIASLIPGNPVKAVAACMHSCVEIGVLEAVDGVLCFAAWERRNVARQSDTPEAINERVRRHREKKRAERNGEQRSETSETPLQGMDETASNALEIDVEEEGDRETDKQRSSTDVDGPKLALAPLTGSEVVVKRTVEAITSRFTNVMAEVAAGVRERLTTEEFRKIKAEILFAYWATKFEHRQALYDTKRERKLLARLKENGDNIHELLYALDGAFHDDWIMGRDQKSDRKYDSIETIFRDRNQIERFASTRPKFRAKEPHPLAVKYAEEIGEAVRDAATPPPAPNAEAPQDDAVIAIA